MRARVLPIGELQSVARIFSQTTSTQFSGRMSGNQLFDCGSPRRQVGHVGESSSTKPGLKNGTEPNTYMITDIEGKGPKTIGIVSSTADLAPHVGHKIAITGTAVSALKAEKEKNVPKAEHYMKVTAIKMISETCP
jgi:hypothetical protein